MKNYNGFGWIVEFGTKRLERKTEGIGNQRMDGDYPDYRIVKIGQNSEKSHGYFIRFAVTQTPVKDHQVNI